MALQLKEPVIVSKMAARKKITGNFEFHDPNALLEKLSLQLGLIWYFDGQAIYIYDASEMRNAVVSLRNVSLNEFNNFLKRSGLYNKIIRYVAITVKEHSMFQGHPFMLIWWSTPPP